VPWCGVCVQTALGLLSDAGLCAIALTNEEYADEAVRSPLVAAAAAYLTRAAEAVVCQAGSSATTSSRGAPPTCAATAWWPVPPKVVVTSPVIVRQARLLGCLRLLACLGEYVEVLPLLLEAHSLEACLALLQAYGQGGGPMVSEVLQVRGRMVAQGRVALLVQLAMSVCHLLCGAHARCGLAALRLSLPQVSLTVSGSLRCLT